MPPFNQLGHFVEVLGPGFVFGEGGENGLLVFAGGNHHIIDDMNRAENKIKRSVSDKSLEVFHVLSLPLQLDPKANVHIGELWAKGGEFPFNRFKTAHAFVVIKAARLGFSVIKPFGMVGKTNIFNTQSLFSFN